MKVWGLTGGVGMGKSTAADFLRGQGIPVVDTDHLAAQLVQPGEPALDEIRLQFGSSIVGSDGALRREELARIVFSDAIARRKLEGILHPRIRQAWLDQLEVWRGAAHPLAVVVIPLLFETEAESSFEKILCVACSSEAQWERLAARGWAPDHSRQRIAAQWPIEQKIARADFVVWTEGLLEVHHQQIQQHLRKRGA